MANENSKDSKPLTESFLTRKPKTTPKYDVHRDVMLQDVIIKNTGYMKRDKSIPSAIRRCWSNWSCLALFTGCLPLLQWIPNYSLRRDLIGDIIAGFTVAVMNIPHGMAYGILAGVTPEAGLYMAIFPTLIYMIFGTSRHISIGTFAVISMMTLKVVQHLATDETKALEEGNNSDVITPLQVVTVLALTVGLIHLAMSLFRMGMLAALLSDALVSGFTTGAAFHVMASQLKDLLGVRVPRYKGAFKIIFTLIDLGKSIPKTNIAVLVFGIGIMCFMTLCNEVLKPFLRKYCRIPFPAELIAVTGGTLISMTLNVDKVYGVKLVGTIPNRLPVPELPRFELIPSVAFDSIAIAVVSFSVVMSMGLPFARKHSYEIRPNQELLAIGLANCFGGFFSCLPLGCSLSRSVIQEQTGGATQIASLVSATLIILVVFFAGPFFSKLPRCVLAGVIIIALKPLFMQVKDLKKFASQGKLELLTWILTFFCVVLIDIDIGLLVGIGFSLLALYVKGVKPYSSLLGILPEAPAVYIDLDHHGNAIELPEIKIFRYTGSLNFATSRHFTKDLYSAIGFDDKANKKSNNKSNKTKKEQQQKQQQQQQQENGNVKKPDNGTGEEQPLTTQSKSKDNKVEIEQLPYNCLVFDFSMLGHIDVAGCHALTDIMKEMGLRNVRLFVAAPTDRVYDSLLHGMALGEGPFEIFPTLHDAVLYAAACRTA